MSFLLCPLCGRNVSVNTFDPCSFEVDVLAQEVRGLGKGKGFASTGRHSILGRNDTVEKIADRCLALLELFINEDIITADEVRGRLGIPKVAPVVEREEDETQALREDIEDMRNEINTIISDIADALGMDVDDIETDEEVDDPAVAKLKFVSTRLIDSYGATKEEEGESRGEKIDAITSEIAEALGESADDYQPDGSDDDGDGDEHVAKLRHFVHRLIDDYVSARENEVES
jgi:hypothetical protein